MQKRARGPPDRLNVLTGDWWNLIDASLVAIVNTEKPTTIEEALNGVNSKLWQEASQSEYNLLKQNKTWDLVDLPVGKNIVGSSGSSGTSKMLMDRSNGVWVI